MSLIVRNVPGRLVPTETGDVGYHPMPGPAGTPHDLLRRLPARLSCSQDTPPVGPVLGQITRLPGAELPAYVVVPHLAIWVGRGRR